MYLDPITLQPVDDLTQDRKPMLPRARSAGNTLTNSVQPGQALPNSVDYYRQRAADAYKEGSDLFGKDPDMSEYQAYAKQRGEQGDAAMLNALAAQFAGDSFQPVQAQFLKKAAAAQEPMKIGSGMLTPEGKYLKDPIAAQDQRAQFLLQQAKAYEGMALSAENKQAEIEARKAQQDVLNQLRMMGLNLQAMHLQSTTANANQAQDARKWSVEDRMLDDYEKQVKDPKQVLGAYKNLANTPRSAAGDVSFIYQYMKMLDPGSVVREGEFATAQNAAGVSEKIRNLYNRAATGERLTERQRAEFLATAGSLADVADRRIMDAQRQFGETANRRGVDSRSIFAPHQPIKPVTGSATGDAPPGVDQAIWNAMTPQERALWKKP